MAAIYPHPVHFEEDGQWKEIDNRLELKTENGKEYYGNRASSLQVRFAGDAGEDPLVILKKDSHQVSWDLEGKDILTDETEGMEDASGGQELAEAAAAADQETSQAVKDWVKRKGFCVREVETSPMHSEDQMGYFAGREKLKASHLASEGVFADILPDTDLSYVLKGDSLKENITLKTKEAAREFLITHLKQLKISRMYVR